MSLCETGLDMPWISSVQYNDLTAHWGYPFVWRSRISTTSSLHLLLAGYYCQSQLVNSVMVHDLKSGDGAISVVCALQPYNKSS